MIHRLIILLLIVGCVFAQTDKIKVDITPPFMEFFYQNSANLLIIPIKLKNLSLKTIKYLTLEVDAYNTVGDLMTPELGGRQCKITGPVKSLTTYKTHLDCSTYYRGLVSNLEIRVVSIEYMDGTTNNKPTEYYNFTYNRQENDRLGIKMGIGVVVLLGIFALIGG